ncbi:hypothetical protein TNCT_576501 [Trichonephila clavata]|uniref:Uncharacterized protein n=1 Tax=Trichonephila clavata TaxID=2740835 RepID=A0A8X6K9H9_TRICU|nr:hypothetical protein TNCT_576501 [Trichonephila clavata]
MPALTSQPGTSVNRYRLQMMVFCVIPLQWMLKNMKFWGIALFLISILSMFMVSFLSYALPFSAGDFAIPIHLWLLWVLVVETNAVVLKDVSQVFLGAAILGKKPAGNCLV